MSDYLFQENEKKSRRKALMMTILFHVLIIGVIIYTSVDDASEIKSMIQEWIDATPKDEPFSMI